MPQLAVPIIVAGLATAGATAYSAHQERKAADKATNTQKEIAEKQIGAVGEQEAAAQATAKTKLRAAQARKSNTILTSPDLEEPNTNIKSALGV